MPSRQVKAPIFFTALTSAFSMFGMSEIPAKPISYRDAGVDIDAGAALIDRIKPAAKATDFQKATQRVYHSTEMPSKLTVLQIGE